MYLHSIVALQSIYPEYPWIDQKWRFLTPQRYQKEVSSRYSKDPKRFLESLDTEYFASKLEDCYLVAMQCLKEKRERVLTCLIRMGLPSRAGTNN